MSSTVFFPQRHIRKHTYGVICPITDVANFDHFFDAVLWYLFKRHNKGVRDDRQSLPV